MYAYESIGMIRVKYVITTALGICVAAFGCRESPLYYLEGRYKVVYLEVAGKNITDSMINDIMNIDFNHSNYVRSPKVKGKYYRLRAYNRVKMVGRVSGGESWLNLRDAGFFEGSWLVRCSDSDCCKLVLIDSSRMAKAQMQIRESYHRPGTHPCTDYPDPPPFE